LAAKVGVRVPASPAEALRRTAIARLRTRIRLLAGVPEPVKDPPRSDDLARLELLRSGGSALSVANPLLAAYYQTHHVLEALRVREPTHLAIALAIESSVRIAQGKGNLKVALDLHRRAEELAEATGNPNTLGLIYLIRA